MKINRRQLYSSALMMLIGIATVIESLNYDIKTLSRMGAGYFPLILGVALIIIAAMILVTQPHESEPEDFVFIENVRPWICVLSGVVLFIVLGKYGGLVPATFVLVSLSAFGDKQNGIKACFGIGAFITILAVGIFHFGLQMQFPLFTWG